MSYGEDQQVNCSKKIVQLLPNCDGHSSMVFTVWIMRSSRFADRLRCSAGLAATGLNISTRYCGASPFIALNDKTPILRSIRCLIGSQCRSSRSTEITQLRLETPPNRRAAASRTDCKRCRSHNGSCQIL